MLTYRRLQIVFDHYAFVDPRRITATVTALLQREGTPDTSNEPYLYGFVTELRRRLGPAAPPQPRELEQEVGPDTEAQRPAVEAALQDLARQVGSPDPPLTNPQERVDTVTRVNPRSVAFRLGVRRLYGFQCAVCRSAVTAPDGTPEVQAAHIFPKARDGSDDLRNGICLCRLHHWAFDAGWFFLADDLTILTREELPQTPDYRFVRAYHGKPASSPAELAFRPHPVFLAGHRRLHGFAEAGA